MNYIFLVNFTHFAGDGKSRPTAKGRYKYSNMKKKNKNDRTHNNPSLRSPRRDIQSIREVAGAVFSLSNLF